MTPERLAISRVIFKAQSVEWATPQGVYDVLDAEFHFNFDPCPLGGSLDGLSPLFMTWTGKRVFCNPPYGNVTEWLERGKEAELAVFLLPARTDTRWFHDLVLPIATEIRFIRGRIHFRPKDPKWKTGGGGAPFPSMVAVFKGVERPHPSRSANTTPPGRKT